MHSKMCCVYPHLSARIFPRRLYPADGTHFFIQSSTAVRPSGCCSLIASISSDASLAASSIAFGSKSGMSPLSFSGSVVVNLLPIIVPLTELDFPALGVLLTLDDLVFANVNGRPVDPSTLTHNFGRMVKRAGLSVRFHDLRHSYASLMLAAGVHPKIAYEALRHSTVAITMVYI